MKRYIAALLLLFFPFMSMAGDRCANPQAYTIDRRCYVAEAKRKTTPYNAVVALIGNDGNAYCTGTIVKTISGFFVVTAKHCVQHEYEGVVKHVQIRLQNGETRLVKLDSAGDYVSDEYGGPYFGDWAVYKMPKDFVPGILKPWAVSVHKAGSSESSLFENKILAGYGTLKIMSDKEIDDFKKKYEDFIKKHEVFVDSNSKQDYGYTDGGGLDTGNELVTYFLTEEQEYWDRLTSDRELKVSWCVYKDGIMKNCQAWSGDSGAPFFNWQNEIVGIHTKGNHDIGGLGHAGSKIDNETYDNVPIEKIKGL